MLKTTLRRHFEQIYSNHELAQWFDPLALEFDSQNNCANIVFPHSLFGEWFNKNQRDIFEQHTREALRNCFFTYKFKGNTLPALLPTLPLGKGCKEAEKTSQQHDIQPTALPSIYTFERFMTNKKNDFPLAAAKEAIANFACPKFTPFVVYGKSGTGKTHILHAMACTAKESSPSASLFLGTAREYLHRRTVPATSEQGIFLDEAEQLLYSPSEQEKLTRFLDTAVATQKFIALCFDTHPQICAALPVKLRSRLLSGLVVELKKPDLSIRRKYVQVYNTDWQLGLNATQVLNLAQQQQDFRALHGALTRIRTYFSLVSEPQRDINKILRTPEDKPALTPSVIITKTAGYFSVSPEAITQKNKNQQTTLARQLAIYLCRELLGLPLVQVGKIFGNRNHSSIVYAINKIKELQQSNKVVHNQLSTLKQMCLSAHGE